MKCHRCGRENAGIASFCESCGSPLVVTAQPGSTRVIEGRLARYFSASPKLLRLLPFSSRISGLLELDLVRKVNPIALFVPIALTFLIGLSPSGNGHIESSPFLFQALPIISVFNPFLGYLSAIAFAVGDIIQKLLYDDVYYGGTPTIIDWVGARIGFILSYSSVVTFGVLPGVLARVFQNAMTRRQMQGRSLDGGTATNIASMIAFILGGAIGAAISGAAAIGLEMPSFFLRQSPDLSCANVMITTNINNTIPSSAVSGLVGGIVGPIANSTIPRILPPTPGQAGQIGGIDKTPETLDWKDFGKGLRFPGVRALGDGGPIIRGTSQADTGRMDPYSYTRSRSASRPPSPPPSVRRPPSPPPSVRRPPSPPPSARKPPDNSLDSVDSALKVGVEFEKSIGRLPIPKGLKDEIQRRLRDNLPIDTLKKLEENYYEAKKVNTSEDLQRGLAMLNNILVVVTKVAEKFDPTSLISNALDKLKKVLPADEAAKVDAAKEEVLGPSASTVFEKMTGPVIETAKRVRTSANIAKKLMEEDQAARRSSNDFDPSVFYPSPVDPNVYTGQTIPNPRDRALPPGQKRVCGYDEKSSVWKILKTNANGQYVFENP